MNDRLPQPQAGTISWKTMGIVVTFLTAFLGVSGGLLGTMAQWSHNLVADIDSSLRDIHGRIVANEVHRITHEREADIHISNIKDNTVSLKHLDKRVDEIQQRLGELSTMSQARNSLLTPKEIAELLTRIQRLEDEAARQ